MVYLHAVRSLSRQMKAPGVVPDTFLLNLIIKASARFLEIDDALKVFREMPLYGCEPNEFTYGYIVKAMFHKGRTDKGMLYVRETREKGFVPTGGMYMITYRTLLEEMCRAAETEEAFELLEDLKGRKRGALDISATP